MLKGKAQICILGVWMCACLIQCSAVEKDREAGEGQREEDAWGLFVRGDGRFTLCVCCRLILKKLNTNSICY